MPTSISSLISALFVFVYGKYNVEIECETFNRSIRTRPKTSLGRKNDASAMDLYSVQLNLGITISFVIGGFSLLPIKEIKRSDLKGP